MTTTQHTPGPFEWQDGRMIETTNGETVLEAGIDDDDGETPFIAVTAEDARLIAAAPDLLALLIEGAARVQDLKDGHPLAAEDLAAWSDDARAAIAKAEGRS